MSGTFATENAFFAGFLKALEYKVGPYLQGVPHIHESHKYGFHYHGFWLMYMQVGDFCASRGLSTVPLTRISCKGTFIKDVRFWGRYLSKGNRHSIENIGHG